IQVVSQQRSPLSVVLCDYDVFQMDLAPARGLLRLVDFGETTFCVAVAAIIFNPLFWNLVARWEHRTRRLTALFGSPYVACYCLGFVILLLNVCRTVALSFQESALATRLPLTATLYLCTEM
uniref:Phosphatidylethanolamine N-methyltransferase n=1 Tax=Neogobius melanostomus TaxID=47308 RepID=A0A8C6TTN4_9GOBI